MRLLHAVSNLHDATTPFSIDFASVFEAAPGTHVLGDTRPNTLGTPCSLGEGNEKATEIAIGGAIGAAGLGTDRCLSNASSIAPRYVLLIGPPNDSQDTPVNVSQDGPAPTAIPAPPARSLILAPSASLDVLSADSSTVLSDASSTIPSDVPTTIPSFGGAPGPRPVFSSPTVSPIDLQAVQPAVQSTGPVSLPCPELPAAAKPSDAFTTITLGGLSNLAPSEELSVDPFPQRPSDTFWTFPQTFPPTFPPNGFSSAPSGVLGGNPMSVQPGNDSEVGACSDWDMMSSEAGVDASSTSHALATNLLDLPGSHHSTDLDANEDTDSDCDIKAIGRVSTANLAIIKDEFIEVQKRAKAISEKTGMSPAQILQYWSTVGTRTHTKRNAWNLYSSYFREFEQEELSRLPECKSVAVDRRTSD